MKIRFIKPLKPLYYNLEKWSETCIPLLLITGLSGSGKTTLAKELATKYDADFISFDVLKFYFKASIQSQQLLNLFLKQYPQIPKLIEIQWSKTDKKYSIDILFNYYCNLFYDFLLEYSKKNKKKIILEGIQFFSRMHPSKSIGMPIVIIRNSGFCSFLNKVNRDYKTNHLTVKGLSFIKQIIKDLYIYHIKQKKLLNKYIIYLSILYKHDKGTC